MRWNLVRPWIGTVIRLFLGVVWIWASLSKISSPRQFTQTVRAYDATPEWLSKAIGYGLPVLELCVGILLVLGVATRLAGLLSGVLFLMFLIGLIQAAARGIKLECGCFGGGGSTTGSTSYTLDILRDIGLLVLAAYLVVWWRTHVSVDEYLARNDHVEAPSAKRLRTDQGRRKYNAMLEQRRAAARTRELWLNGSLAVLVVLIALIGVGVQSGRAKIEGSLTASHATVADGVVFGKKAAATVDTYEDFQCPICLNFEKTAGKTLDSLVRSNHAQLRVHMIAILDNSSGGNRYSSRAANAALCASDISVDTFVAYHNLLYGTLDGKQVQPAEDSSGRPNSALETYAQKVGITGAKLTTFDTCVQTEKHKALVQAITERASEKGINATPTVLVNGKSVTASSAAVTKAIAAADAKGPAPVPSKTPSPSKSPAVTASIPPSTAAKSAGSSTPAPTKTAATTASSKAAPSSPSATPSG